jgi:chemotaxis protein MotB
MSKKGLRNDKKGGPAWLLTFGDLLTLLLTFFVLQISFASFVQHKMKSVMSSLREGFGVLEGGRKTGIGKDMSIALPHPYFAKTTAMLNELQEYIRTGDKENITVLATTDKGFIVTIGTEILFEKGNDAINAAVYPVLDKIGDIIRRTTYNVTIEGYTDNIPIKTNRFSTNWELSLYRALSILNYFLLNLNLDSRRFAIVGYGQYHPLYPNTPEYRSKNRRVEIRFEQVRSLLEKPSKFQIFRKELFK